MTKAPTNPSDPDKEKGDPDGFVWFTFTFRLPYTLGLEFPDENSWHALTLAPRGEGSVWRDPAADEHFGSEPFIRMKFVAHPVEGIDIWPEHGEAVLQALYGSKFLPKDETLPLFGADGNSYEQWVSLETPGSRLVWEPIDDKAYAFHRALSALNSFLTAEIIAFGETNVHLITTHDIGPLMLRGAYDASGAWVSLGLMMMHPDVLPISLPKKNMATAGPKLAAGIEHVKNGHPFVPTKMWYWRSLAAYQRGDHVARVISLQTSIEVMLFATWSMALVDQHKTDAYIEAQLSRYLPFESLIKTLIPSLLGGSWDRTQSESAFGTYWNDLYLLRNLIVHAAYEPTPEESDKADAAYKVLRAYVNDRVWAKRHSLPRTMLARIGNPRMLGYQDIWADRLVAQYKQHEGYSWWLPYDAAGRQ